MKAETKKVTIAMLAVMLIIALSLALCAFVPKTARAAEPAAVHVSGGKSITAEDPSGGYDNTVGKDFNALSDAFAWLRDTGEIGSGTNGYFNITLGKNLTEDVSVEFSKKMGFNLELNGNTLTGSLSIKTSETSSSNNYLFYGGTKDVPAADGAITGALSVESLDMSTEKQERPSVAVTLDGLTVGGDVTFGRKTAGTIKSGSYQNVTWNETAGGCIIEGGMFDGAVSVKNTGAVAHTANGSKLKGADYASLTGGTFNGAVNFCDWTNTAVTVDRTIFGGTFNGKVANADNSLKLEASDTSLASFKISEESNSADTLTGWLQSGTTLSAQDEKGYVTLVGETYFAIDDKEYMSMKQIDMAIAAGIEQPNPTVKLLKAYNKALTVGNSMTLDLGDFTVTAASGKTVTVVGQSNTNPISVTIQNGTLENTAKTPSSAINGVALYAQSHVSALKLEKVTVKAVGGFAAYIDNCWDFQANDCTFTSGSTLGTVAVTGSAVEGKAEPHKAAFTACEIENTVSTGASAVNGIGALLSKDNAVELTLQNTDVTTVEMPGLFIGTDSVVKANGGTIDAGFTRAQHLLYGIGIYGDAGADISLDGVTVNAGTPVQLGSKGEDALKLNYATFAARNSQLNGVFDGIMMYGSENLSGVKVTIDNTSVKSDVKSQAYVVDVAGIHGNESGANTSVTISGNSTVTGDTAILNYGNLTVEGGSVEGDVADRSAAGKTVSLVSGTFKGSVSSDNQTAFIQGGTYSEMPDYTSFADGKIYQDNGDGTFGVQDGAFVAKIGTVGYADLQKALTAAQSGDTAELLSDVTVTQGFNKNYALAIAKKSITLDGNGFTITAKCGASAALVVESLSDMQNVTLRDLTIVSDVTTQHAGAVQIWDGNVTLNLEKVTLKAEKAANSYGLGLHGSGDNLTVNIKDSNITASNSGYAFKTFNPVALTVANSTLKGWAALWLEKANNSLGSRGSQVTVTGSRLYGENVQTGGGSNDFGLIVLEEGGVTLDIVDTEMYVTSSSAENANIQSLVMIKNVGKPLDGIAIAIKGSSSIEFAGARAGYMTISGATDSVNYDSMLEQRALQISGGTSNKLPDYRLMAEGYVHTANGDGTYGVKEGTYIARIGTVGYADLKSAFAAAKGGTVVLLDNLEITKKVSFSNSYNFVFDLNGFTISSSISDSLFHFSGRYSATVTNGIIRAFGTVFTLRGATGLNLGALTLASDLKVECTNDSAVYIYGSTTLNTEANITAKYAAILSNGSQGGNPIINVKGGTVKSTDSVAMYLPQKSGTTTISGGIVEGKTAIELRGNSKLFVTGGRIVATGTELITEPNGSGSTVNSGAAIAISKYPTTSSTALQVTVSGGEIEGLYALYEANVTDDPSATLGKFAVSLTNGAFTGKISGEHIDGFISGGTYAEAFESKYLAEGSALVSTDGKYGVVEENTAAYIAQVTSRDGAYVVGYETLQAAIDAAKDGDTVILLDNVTESVTVAEGKELILDFDGFTLTNTAGQHTLVNNGALTINGGTFDNVSHGKAALVNNGTVVMNGGRFTRSAEAGTLSSANGNSWYVIVNEGSMTIDESVTVDNKNAQTGAYGGFSSLIINNKSCKSSGATLTVNGGAFAGGLNTVKNDEAGKLNIIDGTFDNTAQAAVLNWSEAAISGGTFNTSGTATQAISTGKWSASTPSTVVNTSITGGKFNGAIAITSGDGGYYDQSLQYNEISGGTFSEMPKERFFAEGYSAYPNSDGEFVTLEKEIAEADMNALQAYADELKAKYGALYNEASLGKISALLAEGKAKLTDAIASGSDTAAILKEYQSKLDAVAEEQLSADIAALQEKIDALNALTAENHAAVTEQISALGAQLSDLKTALDALTATEGTHYAALEEKLAALQTKLADLDKLNAAIVELDGKVDNLDALLATLDGKVDTVDGLLDALTAKVDEQFKAVTDALAAQKELSEQQIAALNDKIDGLNSALTALKAVTDKLAADENAHYTALTEKITALESKLAALDTLSNAIEALGGRVDDMEALINGLNGKIDDLTDLINSLKDQLAESDKKTEGQATVVTAISSVGGVIVVGLAVLVIVMLVKRRKKAE